MEVAYEWRGEFRNAEVNALHAEAFGHGLLGVDWWSKVGDHSLGWVCARERRELVGFVNVPWDGGAHAFVLDTIVTDRLAHQGIGTELVAVAIREARTGGCHWLHVDFEESLSRFYFGSCGFLPTSAGVINLTR